MKQFYNSVRFFLSVLLLVAGFTLIGCDSGGPTGGGEEPPEPEPDAASVQFTRGGALYYESDSTATISVEIADPGGEAVSVDVVFDEEASEVDASEIGNYSTKTITFPASVSDGDTRDVTVTLVDDEEVEGVEIGAVFTLQNATGEAEIGATSEFTLQIDDRDEVGNVVPIAEARESSGETLTVEGTVTRAHGEFVFIQDVSAGIAIHEPFGSFPDDIENGVIGPGDRLRVTGEVQDDPLPIMMSLGFSGGYEVLSDGDAEDLPETQVFSTLAELGSQGESLDAELVRVEEITVVQKGDGRFDSQESYELEDSSDHDVSLFIPESVNTELAGKIIQDGALDFEGVYAEEFYSAYSENNSLIGIEESDLRSTYTGDYPSGIIYVDADATGANDGTSWADAFTYMQDALSVAEAYNEGIDEVWVAEGAYYPDQHDGQVAGDREATFQLISSVGLYGGFAGTETSRGQRDWEANATVLSGEINISDFPDDNSCHVLNGSRTSATATLDGFTVTEGNASGDCSENNGSGMYIFHGSPTIRNVTFTANHGTGLYNDGSYIYDGAGTDGPVSNPEIINSMFIGNAGSGMYNIGGKNDLEDTSPKITETVFRSNGGRGMYNVYAKPIVNKSLFVGNSGGFGGGMYNRGSPTIIENSIFKNNEAQQGGGIYNGGVVNPYEGGDMIIRNVMFVGNSSTSPYRGAGGGGIDSQSGDVRIINCLFVANSSARDGGGIQGVMRIINSGFIGNTAEGGGGGASGAGEIFNTIFWSNTAEFDSQIDDGFFVRNSLIQGGLPDDAEDGGSNIDANPRFVDADGPDNILGTLDDNLRLQVGSPAIDAGSNEGLDLDGDGDFTDDVLVDFDGGTRIQNGTVDMGAYEGEY